MGATRKNFIPKNAKQLIQLGQIDVGNESIAAVMVGYQCHMISPKDIFYPDNYEKLSDVPSENILSDSVTLKNTTLSDFILKADSITFPSISRHKVAIGIFIYRIDSIGDTLLGFIGDVDPIDFPVFGNDGDIAVVWGSCIINFNEV